VACWLSLCACGHRPATNSTEKNTPWIVAAEKGDVTAVVKLLGGKEHVNDADKEGYTALHPCRSLWGRTGRENADSGWRRR
jgi:ankyrin repeat protein